MTTQPQAFAYGAVLKVEREHTREDLRAMLRGMRGMGLNTVVVWPAVYWWEPQGAHYPCQTGRDLLADAQELGLQVVMELAGQIPALEYAPDFLMQEEYFCTDRTGRRDEGGLGYGYLNFNHPAVRQLIETQYARIAREYRDMPALKGYDLWNETQFTSFDGWTLELFRTWLQEKYRTLDALNNAWDRTYRTWQDLRFTQWMWASVMAFVDYQEFHKDNIGMILHWMRAAVTAEDAAHPVFADNIHASVTMDKYYDRPTDDWTVARAADRYGISFYPKFLSRETPAFLRHQTMTGACSAAPDGRFAVSEMQTHHAAMFNPEGGVSPAELWQWCWEAVAHGADGIIYWKWNPFRKGVQTFGRGLVDLQGRDTPRAGAARRFGQILAQNPRLTACRPQKPTAAILYDRLNQDFTKAYTIGFRGVLGAPDSIYLDALAGLYQTLWQQDVPVRFITPAQLKAGEAKEIPLLFVTTQVTMDEALASALLAYAEQGGFCVCDGKLGEVDQTGLLYPCIPGAGLSQALGFELLDMETGDLRFTLPDGSAVQGGHDRRQIRLLDGRAQVAAAYSDGSPAALCIPRGRGTFCYLSTFLWFGCRKDPKNTAAAARLLEQLYGGPLPTAARCCDPEVNVQRLDGSGESYLFAFNYGADRTAGLTAALPAGCPAPRRLTNILTGEMVPCTAQGGRLHWEATLAAGETTVWRLALSGEACDADA